jgi:hypothetical protein
VIVVTDRRLVVYNLSCGARVNNLRPITFYMRTFCLSNKLLHDRSAALRIVFNAFVHRAFGNTDLALTQPSCASKVSAHQIGSIRIFLLVIPVQSTSEG